MSVFNTFQSMYLPTLLRWIWTTVSSAVVCIIDHSPIFFLSLINTGSLIRTTANRESRKEKMIYHSPQYLFTNRPQDETRLVGQIHQNYTQYPEVASITSPKSTLRIITKAFQEKQVISTPACFKVLRRLRICEWICANAQLTTRALPFHMIDSCQWDKRIHT